MENVNVQFGIRVRNLRLKKKVSQEKFAGLIEIDRTYMTDIENGKRNVSLAIIQKIAKGFDLKISELLEDL
ncbi:helix-turn-helix domain-containing protein [Flammeovirga pacifica]|uniref:Transcriptional regulator n=1 Tax=Flammeovirga pacifica TaxID=915059 RepID=A0A1S1YVQ4_FLAPC|nr:helix-turn-helix transcriptional regulator [Flammeovirga pacifica]OHX65111.1 transcriptional regulator [Flammeovirga pacifica]